MSAQSMSDSKLPSLQDARDAYAALQALGLKINLARGLPSAAQLALSEALLSLPGPGDYLAEDGQDCRNYMGQQGLPEARRLFAPLLGTGPDNVVVYGNSSLGLIHDALALAMRTGVPGGDGPWMAAKGGIAFLCPVPGYDRHHNLNKYFGIDSIPVPLTPDGPDMAVAMKLIASDPRIRGIWCVPKYSNPTGAVYSDAVIEQLASCPAAAPDFRIIWDNAYALHHLGSDEIEIPSILERCAVHNNPNRAWAYASTSKMTFAGAGVAMFGASDENLAWWLRHTAERSPGPDKINQLRHVRFLKDFGNMQRHMREHGRIMAPKFNAVDRVFSERLGPAGFARWTKPRGGYFICLDVMRGTARRTVELAEQCGVKLTAAGAPFIDGVDPNDMTLRIAPSFPPLAEVERAAEVTAASALLAAAELLASRPA